MMYWMKRIDYILVFSFLFGKYLWLGFGLRIGVMMENQIDVVFVFIWFLVKEGDRKNVIIGQGGQC